MALNRFRAILLAGGTIVAAAVGTSGQATAVGTAYVIERQGSYTLVNNTAQYVYDFFVTNPGADFGGDASTSQTGWTSAVVHSCCGSGGGNGDPLFPAGFEYFSFGTQFDLAPGHSSGRFLFTAPSASDYVIYLRDSDDNNHTSISGTAQPGVPEPASWLLMLSGLGTAGAMLRRRRYVRGRPATG